MTLSTLKQTDADTKQCPRCLRIFRRWGQTPARPFGRSLCRACNADGKHDGTPTRPIREDLVAAKIAEYESDPRTREAYRACVREGARE